MGRSESWSGGTSLHYASTDFIYKCVHLSRRGSPLCKARTLRHTPSFLWWPPPFNCGRKRRGSRDQIPADARGFGTIYFRQREPRRRRRHGILLVIPGVCVRFLVWVWVCVWGSGSQYNAPEKTNKTNRRKSKLERATVMWSCTLNKMETKHFSISMTPSGEKQLSA